MIDQKVLDNLISKKTEINNKALTYGLKEVTVFNPIIPKDKKKLHFFADYVDLDNTGINLFQLKKLEKELSTMLDCPVRFIPQDAIDSDFKEIVMRPHNNAKLSENNEENIKNLFNNFLITNGGDDRTNSNKISFKDTSNLTFYPTASLENSGKKNGEEEAIEFIKAAILSSEKIANYVSSYPEVFDKMKDIFSSSNKLINI